MTDDETRQKGIADRLGALVIIAALATIPLTFLESQDIGGIYTRVGDWIIWLIFVTEFLVLYRYATNKRVYVRSNWLTVLIIVVSFPLLPLLLSLTRLLRLARLFRLLRLLRLLAITAKAVRAIRQIFGRQEVLVLGAVTIILVLAGGATLALLEPDATGGAVWNGIWWAIVTSTTVGYGDIAPETTSGRIIGIVLMLLGIGIVGTLAASIAAFFIRPDDGEGEVADLKARIAQLEQVDERLARIEENQHRIEALLREEKPRQD